MRYREYFVVGMALTILFLAVLNYYFHWSVVFWLIAGPIIGLGVYDFLQKKHAIRRNFPLIGNLRYFFEEIRPELQQYFVESDTSGVPINRVDRSVIYQRAKNEVDTMPFGTRLDVYQEGYEWIQHSIYPVNHEDLDFSPRVCFGGKDCQQPYSASILNISAMSFGSLSPNAILAMNKGAKMGKFAQNTGEGGISPYHLRHGGDLIWQIGTGYFGARDYDGNFDMSIYEKNAQREEVKMIELKLSQGAKPGHGGILPAAKNTPEIAAIRHVRAHTEVNSPPAHAMFGNAEGLLKFVAQLRKHSGGKPTGIKLCLGDPGEFEDICRMMVETKILPDFITIDGGEGGTGAAPPEFSNYVGMPLYDGLTTAIRLLEKYELKSSLRVIASGKVFTGFQIAKLLALGADTCNAARAMMIAVGCIQALECNLNTCPTGVATQDKSLMRGLDIEDKAMRLYHYQKKTIHSLVEIMAAAGIRETSGLRKSMFYKRISESQNKSFEELYP